MRKRNPLILLFVLMFVTGCGLENRKGSSGTYALFSSADGTFLVDSKDGTVFAYKEGKLTLVPKGRVILKVGDLYKDENGNSIVYKGELRFATSTTEVADAILKKYPPEKQSQSK